MVDREEFRNIISNADLFDKTQMECIVQKLKHNICQNLRIARKLSNINPEKASQVLGLEPQSLRRIEAINDRDDFSSRVLILAIMYYQVDTDFYFKSWKENEKLLQEK